MLTEAANQSARLPEEKVTAAQNQCCSSVAREHGGCELLLASYAAK
jgi:hypothetical protein